MPAHPKLIKNKEPDNGLQTYDTMLLQKYYDN